jgi:ribosomal protein S18 acetylase RimI-like enzyme
VFDRKEYIVKNLNYRAFVSTVPWDSKLFNVNICSLSDIQYRDRAQLLDFLLAVDNRATSLAAELLITRVKQSELFLINALEDNGFRYIESNYRPYLSLINATFPSSVGLSISKCSHDEVIALSEEVGDMFKFGRYHQDYRISNELADLRYRNWLKNAVKIDSQTVYKCSEHTGETVSFFVLEKLADKEVFLSLVGMMERFRGKGLAKSVWRAMLAFLQTRGYIKVSTSISSHNLAVFNLYVALGFTFPDPGLTFHKWYNSSAK